MVTALTFAVGTGPSHGSLSGSGANLTYTPAPGYSGPDSFTFTVNDGQATSAPATVSITVTPVVDLRGQRADARHVGVGELRDAAPEADRRRSSRRRRVGSSSSPSSRPTGRTAPTQKVTGVHRWGADVDPGGSVERDLGHHRGVAGLRDHTARRGAGDGSSGQGRLRRLHHGGRVQRGVPAMWGPPRRRRGSTATRRRP